MDQNDSKGCSSDCVIKNGLFSLPRIKKSMQQLLAIFRSWLRQYPERMVGGAFVFGMVAIWNIGIFLALIVMVLVGYHLFDLQKQQNTDNKTCVKSGHRSEPSSEAPADEGH
jgi:hypothetical protein